MANIQFRNFARSTLSIGAASGALSLTVASGTGSRFPTLTGAQYFYLTLENSSGVREIVRVTARTGDTLTVVRAQDNTTAQAWVAGDTAALRLNAKAIEEAIVGTMLAANNLSDLADAATARTNLGAAAAGPLASSGITDAANSSEVDALRDVASTPAAASYTLVLGDRGKSVDFTGAASQSVTIPSNASVAFPVGSVVTITNNSANNLLIAITTDTLRQAGTANVGTRTLAPYGVATARKVSSTVWIIGGSGLT